MTKYYVNLVLYSVSTNYPWNKYLIYYKLLFIKIEHNHKGLSIVWRYIGTFPQKENQTKVTYCLCSSTCLCLYASTAWGGTIADRARASRIFLKISKCSFPWIWRYRKKILVIIIPVDTSKHDNQSYPTNLFIFNQLKLKHLL